MSIAATLLLGGWLAVAQPAAPVARPAPDEIARLIAELGADKAAVRDAASRRLWEIGPDAEPALLQAAEHPDAEVRYRAKAVLERFKYGLFADTPPDVMALVQRFRAGDPQTRLQALQQLSQKQAFKVLLALIRSTTDEDQRRSYLAAFIQDPAGVVGQLAAAGRWDETEQLLAMNVGAEDGVLVWVSLLAARGKLDERVAEYEVRAKQGDASAHRILAYLHRGRGDWTAAAAAAERAGDKPLQRALAVERGDWATALRLHEQGVSQLPVPLATGRVQNGPNRLIELLGYSAAFHRLAGQQEAFQTQLAAIRKLAEDNPKNTALHWYCAEAMLINGEPDEAYRLLRSGNPIALFDLLTFQHRYTEALELTGWKADLTLDETWFDALPAVVVNPGLGRQNRFRLATYLVRVLHGLGRRDESGRLLTFLEQVATKTEPAKHQTSADAMWIQLAYVEVRMGLTEAGYEHAGRVIQRVDHLHYLRTLFGSRAPEAEAWFRLLQAEAEPLPPGKLLLEIDRRLGWQRRASPDSSDLERTVETIGEALQKFDPNTQLVLRTGVATTCLSRERPDLARRLLEPIADKQAVAAIKLGDALRAEKRWDDAANWYWKGYESDRQQLVALWLSGSMLIEAGRTDDGRNRQQLADSLALTGTVRHTLALALAVRGASKDAVYHWERLLRTGAFEHHEVNDSARLLADAIADRAPGRAADLWERHMLADLRVYFNFLEFESYLRYPLLVHKRRAIAAIGAGEWEVANRELDRAWKAVPRDVQLAEDVVPLLVEAGRTADADRLFDRTYEAFQKSLAEFPTSPEQHNNLAWLAARLHRRLDEALKLSQEAVRLAPDEPNYLDTLAEVHFHRGDRAEAVRLARRCVELAPKQKTFQRQLERFEREPIPVGPVRPLSDDSSVLN